MTVPAAVTSIVDRLSLVPPESDVSLVLRHAEREEIPRGTFGEDVRLTVAGVAHAEELGTRLSGRELSVLRSSPLPRCTATAGAIARGAGWDAEAVTDRLLGDHGPFVTDASVCGPLFLEVEIRELVRLQLSGRRPPPGMRSTAEGAGMFLETAAGDLGGKGLLNIHVTHDAILAVLVGHLFGLGVGDFPWPGYLDGLLLWRSDERLHFSWRELRATSLPSGDQVT